MPKSILTKLRRSPWSVVSVVVLCLIAASLLSACDSGTRPAATPASTSALVSTTTHTPSPTNNRPPASTPTSRPTFPTMPDELRSTRERATPSATYADLADLVNGNSAFAFELYRARAAEDGNLFFSPYSISLALAMTYAGAGGARRSARKRIPSASSFLRTGCIPPSTNWTSDSPPAEEGRRVEMAGGSG